MNPHPHMCLARLCCLLSLLCLCAPTWTASPPPAAVSGKLTPLSHLQGPNGRLVKPNFPPASIDTYASGGRHRLALLVTERDSAWLGLAQGLAAAGVPFIVTQDWHRALEHSVVVAYPLVSGKTLPAEALRALANHVHEGGVVVAFGLLGGGLDNTFGVAEPVASRTRSALLFKAPTLERLQRDPSFDRKIQLGPDNATQAVVGSLGFALNGGTAEASFNDGSAAIVSRAHSRGGCAYAVGLDFGDFLLRGYSGRADGLTRRYVNGYDASSDVLIDWLANVWQSHEQWAVRIGVVPEGRELPVLLTHDIDYGQSLLNAMAYAHSEAELGIPATYFIQTKYIKDWNDAAFYTDTGARQVAELAAQPLVEIGSHTVAHARVFRAAPFGQGDEQFPTYHPFVKDAQTATGLTIAGELRVSKFLLEQASGQTVVSFRPGHLANPETLPEALAGAGYQFSSSITANDTLSHRPFPLTQGRNSTQPTPIFEFPVTLEDEERPSLLARLDNAHALATRVAQSRGIFVILIHTNITGDKLAFQNHFIQTWKNRAWFTTVAGFGRFWAARNQLSVDIQTEPEPRLLLQAPQPIQGLALELPNGVHIAPSEPGVTQVGKTQTYVITQLEGTREFKLVVTKADEPVASSSQARPLSSGNISLAD